LAGALSLKRPIRHHRTATVPIIFTIFSWGIELRQMLLLPEVEATQCST